MLKSWLLLILMCIVCNYAFTAEPLKVNFVKLKNFSVSETAKIVKTGKIVEVILNSQEFKSRITSHTYNGKLQFVDSDLSPQMVYEKIMRGAEYGYLPQANGNVDISIEMYYQNTSTIGYTCEDCDTVYFNRKFHNEYSEYDEAGNLVHEWTHKLGFDHAKRWSYSRDYSVPYAVGSIVESLANNLKSGKKLSPLNGTVVKPNPVQVPEVKQEPKTYCTRSWKTLWLFKSCWIE